MPPLQLYAYLSHRVMKWLTPFFLGAGALCLIAAVALAYGAAMATAVVAAGLAALLIGHSLEVRPFSALSGATLSLAGVAAGVLESLFTRRTYTVWDPALSIRAETLSLNHGKSGGPNAR